MRHLPLLLLSPTTGFLLPARFNRLPIQSTLDNDNDSDNDNDPADDPNPRRRKRDVLGRAFTNFIGTSSPIEQQQQQQQLQQEEIVFGKAGVLPDLPNFLTDQDLLRLDEEHEKRSKAALALLLEEFRDGVLGDGVSEVEAKKILEYALEEERVQERKRWNERRSRETLQLYNDQADEMVENSVNEVLSHGQNAILEQDAVAREIVNDFNARRDWENTVRERREGIREYQTRIEAREEEVMDRWNRSATPNEVYMDAVEAIRTSRSERLSGPTFGVMGNSLALEGARTAGLREKLLEDRDKDARVLAVELGCCEELELEEFFRGPEGYGEVRMFGEIVRGIVEKRKDDVDVPVELESGYNTEDEEEKEDDDDDEEDGFVSESPPAPKFYSPREAAETWTLTAEETVEAHRLLNLRRDLERHRIETEQTLTPEQNYRSPQEIQPLFPHVEDSERTRKRRKEEYALALEYGLRTEDGVRPDDELLIRELLEGGVTKERSLRLVQRLIDGAADGVIRDALGDLILTLSEDETLEDTAEGPEESVVNLTNVFQRHAGEEWSERTGAEDMSSRETYGSRRDEIPEGSVELTKTDVPPPKTAFFEPVFDANATRNVTTSKLFGTYEEQMFQRFAAKAGVTTEEEKEEFRRNLDEIRAMREKARSDIESEEAFDLASESAKRGVDMSSLNFDDGSSDQILSLIGKRPAKPTGESRVSPLQEGPAEELIPATEEERPTHEKMELIVGSDGNLHKMDEKPDIISARYRALSGGKDEDEEEYREFLKREEEMLKKLEDESNNMTPLPDDFDIDAYAEDVMSEIKPRPQLPKREDTMSLEQIREERRKDILFGEGESVYDKRLERDISSITGKPDWLRMEQDYRGTASRDAEDDDEFERSERDREIEERQKLADEYLERQSGGFIDIAEALGRPYFGSIDEPDDYKRKYSAFSSYEARKDDLLKYTVLTVEDVINVVDWKVDPASTGVNPYLAQVQRPFSEYGALFRLEGCIVDLFGIQAKAWQTVSEKFGYDIRSEEEVRKASLYTPIKAVRVVFGWTDDVIELGEIATVHRSAFNEAFDAWQANGHITAGANDSNRRRQSESKMSDTPRPSSEEIRSTYQLAWAELAHEKGKMPPSEEEVMRGLAIRDWDVAIRDSFGWNEYDDGQIYDLIVEYDSILQEHIKALYQKYGIEYEAEGGETTNRRYPDVKLQPGVDSWLDALHSVDMPFAIISHLESSQLDAVLNVTGLDKYFPRDKRVSSDDQYSDERSEMLGAALRVEQRPDCCVVFDNTPASANVAHDVLMKSISFVNHYPKYELLTADWTVGGFENLDLRSIRTLFMERTDNVPMEEMDYRSGLTRQQPMVRTSFWDEGSR